MTESVLETQSQPTVDTSILLDALADDRARAILQATSDPMTADELSDACDIPLSTTYRQVKRLESAGMLEETTTVDPAGRRASQYRRTIEQLEIDLLDDDVAVQVRQ